MFRDSTSVPANRPQVEQSIDQPSVTTGTLQDVARSVQEAPQGIREVSDAADGQAASTVDESVEQANTVANETVQQLTTE